MLIAISSSGKELQSPLDSRFGRAAGFVLHDTDSDETRYIDNKQNLQAAQGAGIQAAQCVVEAGAQAVISGNCGPKAFRTLSAAGVSFYPCQAPSVAEALGLYRAGQLKPAETATAEAHGGL